MSADELKYHRFTSDETVYAIWESNPAGTSYTITFDANGGKFPDGSATMSLSTKKVGNDNLVDPPPNPTREGYTFAGWYRNSPGEYPSVFNYNFTSDATVKAEWSKVPEMLITFDPNGGQFEDGSTTVKNVPLDSVDFGGPLPAVSKSGFTFDGWYMGYKSPSDLGVKFESWGFTGPNSLTAVWIPEGAKRQEPMRIDFIPNGGTITSIRGVSSDKLLPGMSNTSFVDKNSGIGMMMTDEFGNLDSFPMIERDGYTLDGWYIVDGNIVNDAYAGKEIDIPASAEKATLSTVFKDGGLLAAKWVKDADTFTVTFDLNGATGTASAPQKVAKGKTVELPVLKASGAEFKGWGYSTDGKTLIEWKAEYPVTGDLTLYAMWEIESNDILSGLTYRFGNYHEAFGYTKPYYIPKERYQLVFGKIQGDSLYQYFVSNEISWGGNCYGMAATSGMFFHRNGTTTTASFRSGAEVPYDLFVTDHNSSLNLTLTEYIEAVFVSQYSNLIQNDYDTQANLNNLARSAEAVQSTKSPVMIAIRGESFTKDGKSVNSGHAVLGYDVVEVSSTESRLMVYDPNFPNIERYITLTKSGNNYVSWAYRLNDMYDWGTGKTYNRISVVPYSDYSQVWNNRAVRSNNPAFFSTNAANATLLDGTGTVVATIKNGTVSTSNSDITPILTYGVTSDGTACDSSTNSMWLPAGQYTIQTTDSSSKELEATLADVNQSATVSTAAKSITFAVNDDKALNYVQIDQAGVKYDITLSSTLDQGYKDVQLKGTTSSGGMSLAQVSSTLYATGIGSGAALKVDGKDAAVSTLSSEMPDVSGLVATDKPASTNTGVSFPDVKPTAWYAPAVAYASSHGYMNGNADGTFNPDGQVKGTEFAQILYNKEGKPATADGASFKGVADQWYAPAILWAAGKGIITDAGDTAIVPTASLTRQQIALMLYNYMGKPVGDADLNKFSDADKISDWAVDAVKWAVSEGIFKGNADGTFNPTGTAKRSETAQILMNFFG